MDDRLKELMQRLGSAINESLSDSDAIAQAIGEIKQSGYDVFLVLEATIGFNKRSSENDQTAPDASAPRTVAETITLTSQDEEFLRSLKISVLE